MKLEGPMIIVNRNQTGKTYGNLIRRIILRGMGLI